MTREREENEMKSLLTVCILGAALLGCAPQVDVGAARGAVVLTPAAFNPATTCNPGLRVGVALGSVCPAPLSADWSMDMPTTGVVPSGHIVCRYVFVGSTYTPVGLPSESSRTPADWLDPDCPAVVPLAGDDPLPIVHPHAHALYQHQMERVSELPYLFHTYGRRLGPYTVRVAIVDSSEDSGPLDVEPMTGDFPHGRAVGMAVREMACPDGRDSATSACIPEFKSYVALDLANGSPAAGGTGYHGYLSTLAERIDDAVNDWLASGSGPLIINLSLGWHAAYNVYGTYGLSRVRHSGAQAVLAALGRAACEGALIIAAVGNDTGGPDGRDGPMYPAAWASESTWSCAPVPLLYAAGGVDGRDLDLATARMDARTELVAPAFHVAVDNTAAHPDPSPPLLPLMSGSSFGAAGVTAAATITWGYRPSLTASEVIDAVYAASRSLATVEDPHIADVCHGTCDATRRVSICETARDAIAAACGDSVPCPPQPSCVTVPAYSGSNLNLSAPPGATSITGTAWSSMPAPECSAETTWGDPVVLGDSPDLCPGETHYGVLLVPNAVTSQPGPMGCHVCALIIAGQNRTLYLSINPEWDPAVELLDPVLYVDNEAIALASALNGQPLTPGAKYLVELPYFSEPTKAVITFALSKDLEGTDGKFSLVEQIEIWTQ